ncbi:MAG: BolA family protein [Qingshengfaniella sp.]
MGVSDEIRDRLARGFAPRALSVTDESEGHRGHAGWREGGETHFRVDIAAEAFAPMTRIQRHRAVHEALGSDLVGRIHALSLNISG